MDALFEVDDIGVDLPAWKFHGNHYLPILARLVRRSLKGEGGRATLVLAVVTNYQFKTRRQANALSTKNSEEPQNK
ncbi:MAG TPA: hypothetical protein DCX06_04770 [Opitutae bacterium]|nr:hypothetical protein [Opitutae bacterium]